MLATAVDSASLVTRIAVLLKFSALSIALEVASAMAFAVLTTASMIPTPAVKTSACAMALNVPLRFSLSVLE